MSIAVCYEDKSNKQRGVPSVRECHGVDAFIYRDAGYFCDRIQIVKQTANLRNFSDVRQGRNRNSSVKWRLRRMRYLRNN